MFWVIDVTGDAPFCWKSEIYSSDKFTMEQVLTIFKNYRKGIDEESGDLLIDIEDFDYTLLPFDTMEEVEEYTEGYHYIM
jgi:hypothetical protein